MIRIIARNNQATEKIIRERARNSMKREKTENRQHTGCTLYTTHCIARRKCEI